MMLITFLPYTVSRCYNKNKSVKLSCWPLTPSGDSSRWWRPSPRTCSGFCFSVVVWWWSVSSRWGGSSFLVSSPLILLMLTQRVCAPGRHRGVRLQPSFPAQRADPDLGEPDLLQAPHPQSHHAGSAHLLHRQRLLLCLLPASRWSLIFRSFEERLVFFVDFVSLAFICQSYALLAIVIFLPYISQFLRWCRDRIIGEMRLVQLGDSGSVEGYSLLSSLTHLLRASGPVEESPDSMLFYTNLPNEPLSKDRVEAFSDGVYAIVATLLILDIWFVALLFLLCS